VAAAVPGGDGDLDDVRESTVRSSVKWRLREFPAATARGGWRLGPWLRRAENGENRRAQRDLGGGVHTRESGGRGGAGGEILLVEVHGVLANRSSE
jgi:hypothetical protein